MATDMDVLVLWADNASANLGVRALAEGTRSLVLRAFGPETDVSFQDFKGFESDMAFGKREIVEDIVLPAGPITKKLNQYDIVVDTGAGDSFTDIYGLKRFAAINYVQSRALTARAKFVMGPQTIGPFEGRTAGWLARRTMKRADCVIARDILSREVATESRAGEVVHATDVVFALAMPIPTGGTDVALNISGLLWNPNRHIDFRHYREQCKRTVAGLIAGGRSVTLFAHVLDNPYPDNDVPAVNQLALELGGTVETYIPSSLEDARSFIAGAKCVIGARMHACLNALSVGVPAIATAYSRKFSPLLKDIGWDHVVELREENWADIALERLGTIHSTETDGQLALLREKASQSVRDAAESLREMVGA